MLKGMMGLLTGLSLVMGSTVVSAAAQQTTSCETNSTFEVGAGIYDITGPAAEEGMMGYAMIQQQTAGIYQRLWARAFVIASSCNGKRVVFVNADLGQIFQGVREEVVRKLREKYGDIYSDDNVLITATHTHSGPGGHSTYTLYNLSTLGFSRQNFDAIVDGIVAAITRAQNNMTPAQIKIAAGELSGISFNRSPESYQLNPQTERDRYQGDVDTEMTLIRFDSLAGKPIGLINWFPVHGVSMNNKNHLINGDNKGYAEYLFEQDYKADYGSTDFVAAFAQANAGDVSPNPLGKEGGEGAAGLQAIEKAGNAQYKSAKKLFDQAADVVKGGVDYRHTFVAMDQVTVDPRYTDGNQQTTCTAAIGVSMLAGTQDGEGFGWQGVSCDTIGSKLPKFVCEMITTPCQGVKPIALQTGTMHPYPWTPSVLPLQVVRIGNLVIVAAPFELTTMTGRRIKEAVAAQLPGDHHVVLSALANAYAGYVATHEEYNLQRYEGASTHFGPWTAAALLQEYVKLTNLLLAGKPAASGPQPVNLLDFQHDLQTGVLFDDKPPFTNFGDVHQDVKSVYHPGDTVEVSFWGGHPKNNYHIQDSFLAVQRLENGVWHTIRQDRDWDTEYHWSRSGIAYSIITINWRIPKDMPSGSYRVVHYGDAKAFWSKEIAPYKGNSSVFTIS